MGRLEAVRRDAKPADRSRAEAIANLMRRNKEDLFLSSCATKRHKRQGFFNVK